MTVGEKTYIPVSELQKDLNRKRSSMYYWLKEFESCGRYPRHSIIRDGRTKYIEKNAKDDFLIYREQIKKGGLIPPFRGGAR